MHGVTSEISQTKASSPATDGRLLEPRDTPITGVAWRRALFLHYRIDSETLRRYIPQAFELERFDGSAWITMVALTMQDFRPHSRSPFWSRIVFCLREQRFLNIRTYVRHGKERGAFFLWGWLSRPLFLPLREGPCRLTCGFANIRYSHERESGKLTGEVVTSKGRFTYSADVDPATQFRACPSRSLAEFALERYDGFFWWRNAARMFRAWHRPWRIATVPALIQDESLLTEKFPWLQEARFVEAHFGEDLEEVWLGQPWRIDSGSHHGASGFYTMP